MSAVGEAYFTGSVPHSWSLGIGVRPVPDPNRPDQYLNIRLSNGTAFYTAGGTTVSGGATLQADQGAPNLLSAGWPVKITDGSNVLGLTANPLWVTGTLGLAPSQQINVVSGSIMGLMVGGQPVSHENPIPVQTLERPTHTQRYDIGTGTIYYGYAQRGQASSSPVWTIKRTFLNASGDPFIVQWALTSSWDSRVGLVYT